MTTRQGNLDCLSRWNDAYEREGFEGAEQLVEQVFHPEVEFSPLLAREVEGRTYQGHEGVRAFFRELHDVIGEIRYAPVEYHPVGEDQIVMLTRLLGAGRGSTVPVDQELGLIYEFRDGLIWRMTAFGSHEEAIEVAREAARA